MRARTVFAGFGALALGAAVAAAILYATDEGSPGSGRSDSSATDPSLNVVTTTTTTSRSQPASSEPTTGGDSASARALALATVQAEGYDVVDPQTYAPQNTLTVLVGINSKSATGAFQHAFFFVDGEYIGTDTKDPSAGIDVAFQSGNQVALNYALYKAADPNCCPTDGSATVRYRWSGQNLEPLDPIPPTDFGVDGSRR